MKNWFKKKTGDSNRIEVKTFHGKTERIAKNEVDFVLLYKPKVSSEEAPVWLKLGSFSAPTVTIPTGSMSALLKIEDFLFNLKNFDRKAYEEILATKSIASDSKTLWFRKVKPNYVLPEKPKTQLDLEVYTKGLYLENHDQWIPWSDYKALEKFGFIKIGKQKFPNPDFYARRYTFKKPRIFGGLQLEEIYTETDAARSQLKLQLPVIQYLSILKLPKPEENLAQIADHLSNHFQQEPEKSTAFKKLEYKWSANTIQVELYCFFRENLQTYDRNAYLKIEYQPDVNTFYTSAYLETDFEPQNCSFLSLDLKADLNTNYRKVDFAAYTPEIVQEYFAKEVHLVLWSDQKNDRFCIADSDFTLIFKTSKIKNLSLDIQFERGREAQNSLQLKMKNGKTHHLGSVESTNAFRKIIPTLTKELLFPVQCHMNG